MDGGAGCGGPQGKELLRVIAPPAHLSHPAALHAGLREVEQELPGAEDLDGAARALMRLQDIYALSVKGLASGVFQRAGHPPLYSPGRRVSLSADDCFHVGKVRESPTNLHKASPARDVASIGIDIGVSLHGMRWKCRCKWAWRLRWGWNRKGRDGTGCGRE